MKPWEKARSYALKIIESCETKKEFDEFMEKIMAVGFAKGFKEAAI